MYLFSTMFADLDPIRSGPNVNFVSFRKLIYQSIWKAYTLIFSQFKFKQFITNYYCSYNVTLLWKIAQLKLSVLRRYWKFYFFKFNFFGAGCKFLLKWNRTSWLWSHLLIERKQIWYREIWRSIILIRTERKEKNEQR